MYSKTYNSNDGFYKTVIRLLPMHYLDLSGEWKDIDLTCEPYDDGYRNHQNIFETRFLPDKIQIMTKENHLIEFFGVLTGDQEDTENLPFYFQDENIIAYKFMDEKSSIRYSVKPGGLNINVSLSKEMIKTLDNDNLEFSLKIPEGMLLKKQNNQLFIINNESRQILQISPLLTHISGFYQLFTEYHLTKKDDKSYSIIVNISNIANMSDLSEDVNFNFSIEYIKKPSVLGSLVLYKCDNTVYENYDITGAGNFYAYNGDDYEDRKYRTGWFWDISGGIPHYHTVHSVKLKIIDIGVIDPPVNVELHHLQYWNTSNNQHYADFKDGNLYHTIAVTTNHQDWENTFIIGTNFVADFQQRLTNQDNWFGIGYYSPNEATNGTSKYAEVYQETGDMEVIHYDPYHTYNILVQNKYNGNSVGGFVHYSWGTQSGTLNCPANIGVLGGFDLTLTAENQQFGSDLGMFKEWIRSSDLIKFTSIEITELVHQDDEYTANYLTGYYVGIDNQFIDGGANGDLIVNGQTVTAPYNEIIRQGNTLNLTAPNQTVMVGEKEVDYVFQNWSDGYTNRSRTITVNGNITNLKAIYKGKLWSNSENALRANGSRKVWVTPGWNLTVTEPLYRVVYEDNGDIYYTEYWYTVPPIGDPYYYWKDETLLSDGAGNSKYPSMAVTSLGRTCIVWQQYDPGSSQYSIVYRKKPISGVWNTPVTVTTGSTTPDSKPVAGVSSGVISGGNEEYTWTFVWNNGDKLKYCHADRNDVLTTIEDVPLSDANSKNPTITNDPGLCHSRIGIAWEKSENIWFWELQCSNPGDPSSIYPLYDPINISAENPELSECHSPSIALSYSNYQHIMLTWVGKRKHIESPEDGGLPGPIIDPDKQERICARIKDENGEWGYLRTMSYDDAHHNLKPSVGSIDDTNFSLLWKIDDSNLLARLDYIDGIGWNTNSSIEVFEDEGIDNPSTSCGSTQLTALWSKYTTAPFRIVQQQLDPPSGNIGENINSFDNRVYREATVDLSEINQNMKGYITLIFDEFRHPLNDRRIPFSPDSVESEVFMGSSVFQADSTLDKLGFNLWIWGHDLEPGLPLDDSDVELFRIVLQRSNNDGEVLNILKRFKLKNIPVIHNGSFLIEEETKVDLSDQINQYLQINTEFLRNLRLRVSPSFVESFCFENHTGEPSGRSAKISEKEETVNIARIINRFVLYPAYPNPFNPATTISFNIPEACEVTLRVYDIQGKFVQELVNERKEPGNYRVKFDGSRLASGIYFYQLKAGEFSAIKKLMLVK